MKGPVAALLAILVLAAASDVAAQAPVQVPEKHYGYQAELAFATNYVWRGVALWGRTVGPGFVLYTQGAAERLGGHVDVVGGFWMSLEIDHDGRALDFHDAWYTPYATVSVDVGRSGWVDLGYAVYLEPSSQPIDYQHDFQLALNDRVELPRGWAVSAAVACHADPIRRLGVYLRGTTGFDWTFRSLTLAASLNVAVSRYHGTDAVPWGLQDLTLSGLARWFVHGPLYVSLSGTIAYSRQAWVSNEGRWAPAIAFAVGAMR